MLAVVEAWKGTRRVAIAESGPAGHFALVVDSNQAIDYLTVRAIGFAPSSLGRPFPSPLVLSLRQITLPLPQLQVKASEECGSRGQSNAQRYWNMVLSKYVPHSESPMLRGTFKEYDDLLAYPDLSAHHQQPTGEGLFGITPAGREQLEQVIRAKGYKWPGDPSKQEKWSYAPLERELLTHFSSPAFATSHFAVKLPSPDRAGPILLLCSKSRRSDFLDVLVYLRPDSTIESLAWSFRQPSGPSEAGGAALLLPVEISRSGFIPSATMFWRRISDGKFRQRTYVFSEWSGQ